MLTATRIEEELAPERAWLCWITALKASAIKKLAVQKYIQPTFFAHTDLAEITSPDFPGEHLIVCRNPLLAEERTRKREELLQATERELQKIVVATQSKRSRLQGKDQIGMRVGKHIDHYHMGKHFECEITDTTFANHRRTLKIQEEAALDGIYVIRPNVPAEELSPEKTVGLHVRPIHHHWKNGYAPTFSFV